MRDARGRVVPLHVRGARRLARSENVALTGLAKKRLVLRLGRPQCAGRASRSVASAAALEGSRGSPSAHARHGIRPPGRGIRGLRDRPNGVAAPSVPVVVRPMAWRPQGVHVRCDAAERRPACRVWWSGAMPRPEAGLARDVLRGPELSVSRERRLHVCVWRRARHKRASTADRGPTTPAWAPTHPGARWG